ncbi:MAG: hypothetical protein QOH04_1444 [Sphingomonadales bacterium]|jgi:hypothetical protein|nr:hypothetical protein [Sphingomonadales bacterium]
MRQALIGAAAGTALLAGGFALTAAWAGDDEGKARTETRTEQVIVLTDRKGGEGSDDPHVRTFVMDHGSAACTGAKDEVNESSADGREKTRIIVCGNGDVSPALRAERLQHALARIEANDSLSAEHKEKVVAALRDAIARLQTEH